MEVLESQISCNWNDYSATIVDYGHGFGEDVVDADFSGNDANYVFVEVTLKLPPMCPRRQRGHDGLRRTSSRSSTPKSFAR